MAIVNGSEPEAKYTTVTGRLPDQAALMGVLNALYDRHIAVLSVEISDRNLKTSNTRRTR